MLWWIAGIGVSFTALAALIYARVQKYGKINAECIKGLMTPPMIHQELYKHLEETASRLSIRRKRRLRLPVHFQRRLETLMLRMHRGAADDKNINVFNRTKFKGCSKTELRTVA